MVGQQQCLLCKITLKNVWNSPSLPQAKEVIIHWQTLKFAERRIIYNFEKYGDSPACIGKEKNLKNQKALTQGFGITENTRDLANFESKLLETNVTVISNDECYAKIKENPNVNLKGSARIAMPEGVTDQMLCTLGIVNGSVVSVSFIITWNTLTLHCLDVITQPKEPGPF